MDEAMRHFRSWPVLLLLAAAPASAQPAPFTVTYTGSAGALKETSTALADLAARASPAVVQILVTAMVPAGEGDGARPGR